MDGWMDGWVDKWIDGWMDGLMGAFVSFFILLRTIKWQKIIQHFGETLLIKISYYFFLLSVSLISLKIIPF